MDKDRARRHGREADLISAVPTDLLLQVLVRLRCARAAARTSILSRRWRGLWTRLPELTFRDVAPGPLLAALSSVGPTGAALSLLDIHIPEPQHKVPVDRGPPWAGGRARRQSYRLQPLHPTNQVTMLLRAAGRLSPAAFRFSHPHELENPYVDVDLSSCFRRATSIELDVQFICFPEPRSEFPALENLSLSGCLVRLAVVVPLCPRLRVLRVPRAFYQGDVITVRSASLQELLVENEVAGASTRRVDVEAPALKQLTVFFRSSGDLSVSVLAPAVEEVSWRCMYSGVRVGLGLWGLMAARLMREKGNGRQGVLAPAHVMFLRMVATGDSRSFPDAELSFRTEIEKHMITQFSGLEVHLRTPGHVFGAFLLRLLGMHPFRTAARSLKVVLQRFERKDGCPPHCPSDEPNNRRTQTISLTNLGKLDIIQFKGVDHEFDFLKVIFRCAPMLHRVTVELPKGFTPNDDWWTKIHNIFMAYPSVECSVDCTPGS